MVSFRGGFVSPAIYVPALFGVTLHKEKVHQFVGFRQRSPSVVGVRSDSAFSLGLYETFEREKITGFKTWAQGATCLDQRDSTSLRMIAAQGENPATASLFRWRASTADPVNPKGITNGRSRPRERRGCELCSCGIEPARETACGGQTPPPKAIARKLTAGNARMGVSESTRVYCPVHTMAMAFLQAQ